MDMHNLHMTCQHCVTCRRRCVLCRSDSADEVIAPLANQLLAMSQGQFMTQFMVRFPSGAVMPVNLPLSAPTASVVVQQPPTQLPRDSNSKNTSPSASFFTKQVTYTLQARTCPTADV